MGGSDTRPLEKTPETGRDTTQKPYFGVNDRGNLTWMNEEPS